MESKIIVALDFDSESKTLAFVDRVDPAQCRVKVGKELFTRCGPALVKQLVARNFDVFLDLKFHDIPNTVAHAVAAAADLGVWMTNVHASGGREMMVAARDAVATLNPGDRPLVIAVTVLTSLAAADLQAIGVSASPAEQVLNLARLAQDAGLDWSGLLGCRNSGSPRGDGCRFLFSDPWHSSPGGRCWRSKTSCWASRCGRERQ